MLTVLMYISLISGGILVLMLLLSLLGGLELDFDLGETDFDAAGLGIIKGVLTFLSVGAYVVRSIIMTDSNPGFAFVAGILAGAFAVFLLAKFLKVLLRNQENVNWSINDALYTKGKVYLKIPEGGQGIVQIRINGVNRELKSTADKGQEIPTGTSIIIVRVDGEAVVASTKLD